MRLPRCYVEAMPRFALVRHALGTLTCVLLGAALLAAGCGGGTDDGARTLSKREYIQRADALQVDAVEVFTTVDGRLPATPAQAVGTLAAIDDLIAGYERLVPPPDWSDEHETMLGSLRTMRQSLQVVAKASAKNERVIAFQVGRYQDAKQAFDDAVRSINASR